MKNIKARGFKNVLLIFIFCMSCNKKDRNSKEPLHVNYLDIKLSFPWNSPDEVTGPGQMYFILELKNTSKYNYYLELDNWSKEKKDSIFFYATLKCKNRIDSASLNLAYVSSPFVFLSAGQTDTIVLKTDFRELQPYVFDCLKTNDETTLSELTKNIHLRYMSKHENMTLTKGGKAFVAIDSLSLELNRKYFNFFK